MGDFRGLQPREYNPKPVKNLDPYNPKPIEAVRREYDPQPAKNLDSYRPEQIEAAITLQGFKEMLSADPQRVVHKDESGQEFTEQDHAASMIADRINNTPYYQEQFGIGGDTGRKVIGFQPLVDDGMIAEFGEEALKDYPRDAFVPIIQNGKTQSTGPMTRGASSDPADEVEYITLSDLERLAAE